MAPISEPGWPSGRQPATRARRGTALEHRPARRRRTVESLHVCPRCESELVYPIDAALDADQILPEDF